ncbi:MAG: glucose 1-dehydrogenase [Proteobacteria bacterium]|nr:glucose 1-dehydrogenase [Pseudomonadota bacterium]
MRLKDKVAFITGGGGGIGRVTSRIFASEGAKIVVVDIDREAGQKTVDLVEQDGGEAIFLACNVAVEEEVRKAVEAGAAAFSKLNILFNNAGVLWRDKDFEVTKTDESIWDQVMAINLKGVVWVCKYGIPELIKQGGGSVINIGSGVAFMGFTRAQDAYTASKGGMISLTRSMAIVYAKHRIRVNIVHPGPVNTPMQKEWDEETKKAVAEWIPLGRLASAEDIAYCGLFLASDESSYITGADIMVDGGIMVKAR